MRESGEDAASAAAWCVVLLVHVAIAGWLIRMRLPSLRNAASDDVLMAEFIRRPELRRPTPPIATAARRNEDVTPLGRRAPLRSSVEDVGRAADAPASVGARTPEPSSLDLRVPEPPTSISRLEAFERPRVLESKRTRFAGAWVPEGDALRQASFRSPAVGFATGLFGGPPQRCNEIQRRLRKENCLPLHGQDAEDEALRRRHDP